jgi:hypothetical protein
MKKISNALLCIILLLLVGFGDDALGQAPLPAQNLNVHLKVSPSSSQLLREVPPDSINTVLANLPLTVRYVITLADTANLDSVAVKLGSSAGGSQYFQGTFPAHGADSLANGQTFQRKGNLA